MIKNDANAIADIALTDIELPIDYFDDDNDDSYDRNICNFKLRKLIAMIYRNIANAYDESIKNEFIYDQIAFDNDKSCAVELINAIENNIDRGKSIELIDAFLNCDKFDNAMRDDDLIRYDCIHDLYIEDIISYDDDAIQNIIKINSHIDCKNLNSRSELNARDNI